MLKMVINRVLYTIPTLILISIVSFAIIELPPGDYLTTYITQLEQQGTQLSQAQVEAFRLQYGLDQPLYMRYWKWVTRFMQGDMGYSFDWHRPVNELVYERIGLTVAISLLSTVFIWVVALPIGIYSATRQYSIGDYTFTLFGFLGIGVPDFLLALGGLYPPEYINQPWTWDKILEVLKRIWVPMIIIGTSGTAGMIRTMRANLLDELHQPYVESARASGLSETKVILKYPVRIAMSPFISTVGWMLPHLISGATIVSVVMSLPTTGPLLLKALQSQDMYLAASFIMLLSVLTVIGTLISDILLTIVDPRIRYGNVGAN
jgi:peptide/nickel transport system permease protein